MGEVGEMIVIDNEMRAHTKQHNERTEFEPGLTGTLIRQSSLHLLPYHRSFLFASGATPRARATKLLHLFEGSL